MRLQHLFAILLPLGGVDALSHTLQPLNSTDIAPKKFILEAAQGTNIDALTAKVKASGATILRSFNTDVFTGVSIESTKSNVDTLQAVQEVKQAWSVGRVQLSPYKPSATFSDDAAAANYSFHSFTGVDKAHDAGIFGKGAVIAVVDTGTDYLHPALGGGFGPGFKVAGGADLVGDGGWPVDGSSKVPDSDPFDNIGHGTHVAGIIAGKSEWFTGVAPEATLLSYKVFADADATDEDTLIDAFLQAYEAGADIITSSIGAANGWSDGAWATIASRLVDLGVVVTISAGNNGVEGPFFASSGSSVKNVIAVASTDASVVASPPFKATFVLDGTVNTSILAYQPAYGSGLWTVAGLPIIPVSLDPTNPADACSPLPDTTPDLAGGIALVRRGTCSFSQKQANVAKFGAKYILLYNNENPWTSPAGEIGIPLALIEAKAGEAIIATVKAGGNVTADFTPPADSNWAVGFYNSGGGIPSEFTSFGGTYELEIKPDVAAPGGSIYSTYLDGSWAVMSGTSMACPYVAGIAALYVSKYGGRSTHGPGFAKDLASRIITSGAAVPWQVVAPSALPIDYGFWAPVPQVGTGLVNAWKVLTYQTSLSFSKFELNDTAHFARYHEASITNNGDKAVTYKFTLQPAGGFNAQSDYPSYLASFYQLAPISIVPKVSFPSGTFSVQPGATKKAQFGFNIPAGMDESRLPVYSGKILVSGSNGEELSIPYLGAGFDLKKSMRRALFADATPYQVSGVNRDDVDVYHAYDFDLSWDVQGFPEIYADFKWGVKQLRFDVYEAGWKESRWTYPPVVGEDGYVGSATSFVDSSRYWAFDPAVMDKEDVIPFPLTNLLRTSTWNYYSQGFWWFGKLANGTYIVPGNYTIRFAAQIPFSDPVHSDNWDIWETPTITILPYKP